MTFQSNLDKHYLMTMLTIIFCFSLLIAAVVLWQPSLSNEWRIAILIIGFFIMSFFAYFTLGIHYVLTPHYLIVHVGPFKKRVAYQDILFIHATTRHHRAASATQTLTLYAINRKNMSALIAAKAHATRHGMTLNRYLVRFIAETNNRKHYIKEGFDPSTLRLLTISPSEQHLFITELLQHLEHDRT